MTTNWQAERNGGLPPAIPQELLALLLATKAQMEADAVELESTTRWCRTLEKLIEQDGMPKAWDQLVAYLKEHGHG